MSIAIYSISPRYRKLEVWNGCAMTRQRISVHTTRPNAGQTHRQRYEIIARKLGELGVGAPPYHPNH